MAGVSALSPSAEAIAARMAELVAERVVEDAARRVTELLREQDNLPLGQLVDAATVARELGLSRDTVYAHADELGADPPRRRPALAASLRPCTSARGLGSLLYRQAVGHARERQRQAESAPITYRANGQ